MILSALFLFSLWQLCLYLSIVCARCASLLHLFDCIRCNSSICIIIAREDAFICTLMRVNIQHLNGIEAVNVEIRITSAHFYTETNISVGSSEFEIVYIRWAQMRQNCWTVDQLSSCLYSILWKRIHFTVWLNVIWRAKLHYREVLMEAGTRVKQMNNFV